MATQTRFDLNAAIEGWRNELAAQPQLVPDERRELEKHLADSVADLQQRGLSQEESFWLAQRRIGRPGKIAEEFEKEDPAKVWRDRVLWILVTLIALQIWGRLTSSLCTLLTLTSSQNSGLQNVDGLLEPVFYFIPVLGILALIATGRLIRLISWLSPLFQSRMRLGSVLVFLVVASSFFAGLTDGWRSYIYYHSLFSHLTSYHSARFGPPSISTIENIIVNIAHSLIFIILLVWLMPPQSRKTPKLL